MKNKHKNNMDQTPVDQYGRPIPPQDQYGRPVQSQQDVPHQGQYQDPKIAQPNHQQMSPQLNAGKGGQQPMAPYLGPGHDKGPQQHVDDSGMHPADNGGKNPWGNGPKPVDWGGGPKLDDGHGGKNNHNGDGHNGNGGKDNTYDLSVVPGKPNKNDPGQINVVDYGSDLVTDPSLGLTKDNPKTKGTNESMFLEDHNQQMDPSKGLIDGSKNKFQLDSHQQDVTTDKVGTVNTPDAATYGVDKTFNDVANNDMQSAQGSINQNDLVDQNAGQIDTQGVATGTNADGSVNYTGLALKKYASQNIANIIDTSTAAGKALAAQLGEGNYTDSKATLKGQLDILQSEFTDPVTGEAKIPTWASATARNVSKIAAFSGMSGTAATAAMSQALMEASIPIAQADSQFFQTVTMQNLSNKQQSIINTANTLAKMDETNADNRLAAAIQNSKSFLSMDMTNLNNEQQARTINNQERYQSILQDANQVNAERLFVATNQNDLNKYYDQMNTQIKQYNSSQNLSAQEFNSNLADSRQKFEKEMQYNIAVSNAKWRQQVELQEDQQQFEAATTDVKDMVDISNNQLNKIWDRSDSLLDYAWKSSDNELARQNYLAGIALQGNMAQDAANTTAIGQLVGTVVGSSFGQNMLNSIFGGLF